MFRCDVILRDGDGDGDGAMVLNGIVSNDMTTLFLVYRIVVWNQSLFSIW